MRKFLKVAMSEELYNSLQFNANSLNITLSKYCREILKNGYTVNTNNDYSLVVYHLNKIGNNINQIARILNSGGTVELGKLEEFTAEYKKLNDLIGEIVEKL